MNCYPTRLALLLFVGLVCAISTAKEVSNGRNCANHPWPYNNTLRHGESLYPGQYIASRNAALVFHPSGQVQLMRREREVALWTLPATGAVLTLLASGNLVLLDSAMTVVWSSGTNNATVLVVQDDCNAVLYAKEPLEDALWSSGTQLCVTAHIVMHSHDDVGWLLTPERYYDGCETPGMGVRGILTTIVQALADNPDRTFSEVEMYFFNRWWEEQNETTKTITRELVRNGQLEFINAGWSMHDEACVHQESAISNMEVGAQFLRREFGDTLNLNIGWHIDPFGHASTTPRIMAQMGFNAFFFWRTDYQQRQHMLNTKTIESLWDSSPSLGDAALMFTSIMYNSYCSGCDNAAVSGFAMCPSGFCCFYCEQATDGRPAGTPFDHFARVRQHMHPKTDARKLYATLGYKGKSLHPTVEDLAAGYADLIKQYGGSFRTDNVLMPWGCDFQHQDAHLSFALMDAVLSEINNNTDKYGVTAFYSTPSRYMKAVHKANYTWPLNKFDYFLDSDNGHAYWSGYLSSRAEYKGFDRIVMNERTSAEMTLSSLPLNVSMLPIQLARTEVMREACGVGQHHDCITGTERQHVRDRYQFLLTRAMDGTDGVFQDVFEQVTGVRLQPCHLSNLSACDLTTPLAQGINISVYLYNPLAWRRTEIISIPVPVMNVSAVLQPSGSALVAQVSATWELTTTTDKTSPPVVAQPFELTFSVDLPPLGLTEVVLSPAVSSAKAPVKEKKKAPSSAAAVFTPEVPSRSGGADFSISNDNYRVVIDGTTGLIKGVVNQRTGITSAVHQNIYTYCPMPNAGNQQASGAYIFRTCMPNETPKPYNAVVNASVLRGPVCHEVRQRISSHNNVQQRIRLCRGQDYVELTSGIGKVDPGLTGVEVVLKIATDVASNSAWFTDSQALEMQQRVRNSRPNYPYNLTEPVASNFFPCNAFALVNDSLKNLAVVADRSRATASLKDGELEFLVQRRLLYDDNRGVNQPLDENTRVLTTSRLILNSNTPIRAMRVNSVLHTHKPIVRYSAPSPFPAPFKYFEGTALELPHNVFLHTRTVLSEGRMLVRLQHLFARGEGADASTAVLDLRSVLPKSAVMKKFTETDLNGITPRASLHRMDFVGCDLDSLQTKQVTQPSTGTATSTQIVLHPMDIRTFVIDVQWLS